MNTIGGERDPKACLHCKTSLRGVEGRDYILTGRSHSVECLTCRETVFLIQGETGSDLAASLLSFLAGLIVFAAFAAFIIYALGTGWLWIGGFIVGFIAATYVGRVVFRALEWCHGRISTSQLNEGLLNWVERG